MPKINPALYMVAGGVLLFRKTLVKGMSTILRALACRRPFKVQGCMSADLINKREKKKRE